LVRLCIYEQKLKFSILFWLNYEFAYKNVYLKFNTRIQIWRQSYVLRMVRALSSISKSYGRSRFL
jgi:hypothetical protein